MRIQHNIPAMNAYRNFNANSKSLTKNLEKLSSGYKINRAGDDAAGLAISEKMRAQITGLEVAQKNAKDGISLIQTAEGALTEVHDMLNRMVTLAEQSANGTYADDVDREQLQKEVEQLKTEINRIADSSNFNGTKLLDGSLDSGSGATKVDVQGVNSSRVAGTEAVYTSTQATYSEETIPLSPDKGDYFSYNVSTSDGRAYNVTLKAEWVSEAEGSFQLVSEDGTKYAGGTGTTTDGVYAGSFARDKLNAAIASELQKTKLADDFQIAVGSSDGTATDDVLTFTNKEKGSGEVAIRSIDVGGRMNGELFDDVNASSDTTALKETNTLGVSLKTVGKSDARLIAAEDITLYDGTNAEDAVFTINGKKFAILSPNVTDRQADFYANPRQGLGQDVTVLIAGTAETKGFINPEDGTEDLHLQSNLKLIEQATGVKVSIQQAQDADDTTTPPTPAIKAGILLETGGTKKDAGLKLQIGDTSESFNQMKVSIADMHVNGLGIADIDISDQEGAAAAMDKIKAAINKVSDTRGGLGALQNRLEHTINNLSVMRENIQDAESTIRDTDVAEEMMKYTKNNILNQSAQAMLAQANQLPQSVLQLLQ